MQSGGTEPTTLAGLRQCELALAAINQIDTVVLPLHAIDTEYSARAFIMTTLGCTGDEADQVLSIQLCRFTARDRDRYADQIRQVRSPQPPPPPRPLVPPAPESARLVSFGPAQPARDSRPLPRKERALRRAQATTDRQLLLDAIAEVTANPSDVLATVHSAGDSEHAQALLSAGHGWSRTQVIGVLDMQIRQLVGENRRRLQAAD